MIGRAYNIPTVALRFFNIFGPFQALSNPYTGVLHLRSETAERPGSANKRRRFAEA